MSWVMLGWGGVGVLTFCLVRTVHISTLPRSLECLPRYMLLRCRDLWNACHVTCCYAAEISGMLATLHVATLQRSLECLQRSPVVSLLRYMRALECLPRYMLLRCIWGGVLHCSIGFRSVYIIILIIPYVLYRCEMMGTYVFSCFGFSPLQVRDSGAWHALNCCRCTGIIVFSKWFLLWNDIPYFPT